MQILSTKKEENKYSGWHFLFFFVQILKVFQRGKKRKASGQERVQSPTRWIIWYLGSSSLFCVRKPFPNVKEWNCNTLLPKVLKIYFLKLVCNKYPCHSILYLLLILMIIQISTLRYKRHVICCWFLSTVHLTFLHCLFSKPYLADDSHDHQVISAIITICYHMLYMLVFYQLCI